MTPFALLAASFSLSCPPQPATYGHLNRLVEDYSAERATAEQELIDKAKEVVDDPKQTICATCCIQQLARLRAKRAVGFMVDHLTYSPRENDIVVSPIPTLADTLPCVYGLIEIGTPSFGPLLEKVKSSSDGTVHEFAARVFKGVLGNEIALLYLRHAAGSEKDIAKLRIESVATWIEKKQGK